MEFYASSRPVVVAIVNVSDIPGAEDESVLVRQDRPGT
jgi:hypothetical protein